MAIVSGRPAIPSLDDLVATAGPSPEHGNLVLLLLDMDEGEEIAQQDLTRIVLSNRWLAGRLRRVASTEAVALAHPIPTIRHAVEALGFRAVHSTALACSFIDTLAGTCQSLHFITFWRHSVGVGMLAQVLAAVEQQHRDLAFTAGVLHNIGRLVLDREAPAVLSAACMHARVDEVSLPEAVHSLLGFDDVDIAGIIARRWELPDPIPEAVSGWRAPDALVSPALDGLVARAAAYAAVLGLSDGLEPSRPAAPAPELAPVAAAMEQLGGLDWLNARIETIVEAALLS